jgi:hypothetical protein
MMDPNSTYPIVLNATLNATLIQSPQPLWKDWFPAIVSILVVILGSLSTYYVTIMVERNKRKYELKKGVYFEALEILSEYGQFIRSFIHRENDPEGVSSIRKGFINKLSILKFKLEFCGAPWKIIESISEIREPILQEERRGTNRFIDTYLINENMQIISDTINQLRIDMWKSYGEDQAKHWWQFWR